MIMSGGPFMDRFGLLCRSIYENKIKQFFSCALCQEEVDFQECYVGAKDYITL